MWRARATLAVLSVALGAQVTRAQERSPSAGRVEVSAFPGGSILFAGGGDGADAGFTDYALGVAVTINAGDHVAVEYELGGSLGGSPRLDFGGGRSIGDITPRDTVAYNVNLVIAPGRNDRSIVPYVTGGLGGLTVFQDRELGFTGESLLSGNVGGGAKWFFGRWGVRGDYRVFAIHGEQDAAALFWRRTRYGHRVYAGIILNLYGLQVDAAGRQ